MHKKFDSTAIEKKWQGVWKESGIYDVSTRDNSKEKEYVLVEWPYPSGNLHIGHWYAFAVPDIYVRYQRMQGKQVLFPMGFDAFGLPAENAAIKRKLNPKTWTNENIAYMTDQLASMGNAFTWNKTTSSTDPEYYKWTQAMFTRFFDNDIAYRGKGIVNWCPGCNTVIANEQVLSDGTCERSGDMIEKREMPQWMLRITKYADRLTDDLADLNWPEHIKEAQRQWIGRSKGAEVSFKLSTDETVTVFTTRVDTIYGATYLVLAPEHPLVKKNQSSITNWSEVEAYINQTAKIAEQDRLDASKDKTGVCLQGITAINPANNESIPVFISDYVLASYGTGAIMAVPAHDERDFAFATKFNLPIRKVVAKRTPTHAGAFLESATEPGKFYFQLRDDNAAHMPGKIGVFGGHRETGETLIETLRRELDEELELKLNEDDIVATYTYDSSNPEFYVFAAHIKNINIESLVQHEGKEIVALTIEEALAHENVNENLKVCLRRFHNQELQIEPGVLIDSGEFDGTDSEKAKETITKKVAGQMTNTYRLRDWSIGRQRYWGVPIPIVYDPEGKAHSIPEAHLPWLLPEDVDPTPTGVAPLAKSAELKKRTEDIFGAGWTPEVETMDTFVDSSWYFLRYIDNHNNSELSSKAAQTDWMPIDIYFGGAEHTTMHLLYSRFWQKALFDLGLVTETEPYKRRINRGLILGPDGNKMSKSKGNVIDPDEQVKLVGSDTVKMYLAFMGPYEGANYPWDMGGIAGLRRFLERVYGLKEQLANNAPEQTKRLLHKTIKKVGKDITEFKFNTAISAMMIFINEAEKTGLTEECYESFLKLLSPFAPHLTEELWSEIGKITSIHLENYPIFDEHLTIDATVVIGVQINGKVRGTIEIAKDGSESDAVAAVKQNELLAKYLETGPIKKVIYVPGRILNLII